MVFQTARGGRDSSCRRLALAPSLWFTCSIGSSDPAVRFGKPCIRGHRITVQEILAWLSSGASQQQILADYPQLEPEDFLAVYAYAAELAAGGKVVSLSPKVRFETGLLV